jgi:hypothetical protein
MGTNRCRVVLAALAALLAVTAQLPLPSAADAATPTKAKPKAERASERRTEPDPLQLFPTADSVARWIGTYRPSPRPDRLPAAVKAMSAHGVFKDGDTAGLYIGFMAGVLGSDPSKAADLASRMFPLPPEDHLAVIRALAYSGLPNWKTILGGLAERMPARAAVVDRYLTGKLPTLETLPLDSGPAPLDVLWGQYYATGSYEPILRIVAILHWSRDGNNTDRLTVGSMAKWTLAQNASRDMDLLQLLKSSMRHESGPNAATLKAVIEAADIGEVSKIRKEALAQIETLKVKGSEKARNYNWWSQAGQTVLALGCITASALGQAAVGVPCVIGGALSQATLKALAPTE